MKSFKIMRKSVLIYMETVWFGGGFCFDLVFNFFVFDFHLCCFLLFVVVLLASQWSLMLPGTYLLRCL